jgi:hypothetical protein
VRAASYSTSCFEPHARAKSSNRHIVRNFGHLSRRGSCGQWHGPLVSTELSAAKAAAARANLAEAGFGNHVTVLNGALIVADDTNFPSMSGYLDYVRDPANGYVSVAFPIEDGMEISCWTTDRRADEEGAL